jgi:hypothetical protein
MPTLRTLKLVDVNYHDVAVLPLADHEPWPETLTYQGRRFDYYAQTVTLPDAPTTQLYREVT